MYASIVASWQKMNKVYILQMRENITISIHLIIEKDLLRHKLLNTSFRHPHTKVYFIYYLKKK